MRARLAFAACLVGCGGADSEPPIEEAARECLPGDVMLESGECEPPGVPVAGCAPGFTWEDAGCTPVLPAAPCPTGTMALPGETSCRPVAECGGPWGFVAIEPGAHYVDAAYAGADSDGSAARPWIRIMDAIDAVQPGGLVVVGAGTYPEHLDIQLKPVRIWGRCPELVTVTGSTQLPAAVVIRGGASGTTVRAIGISGPGVGVFVAGSDDVVLEELWIHDTVQRGLAIEDPFGPTSVTLRASLVERMPRYGMSTEGVSVVVEQSVVRDIWPDPADGLARGLSVKVGPVTGMRGNLQVSGAIIERAAEVGVYAEGSDATVRGSLLRELGGRAVAMQSSADGTQGANVAVRTSVLRNTVDSGIAAFGSELVVEATVIGDVAADANGFYGRALVVEPEYGRAGKASVMSSLVERVRDSALIAFGSELSVARTLIRNVEAGPAFLDGGYGIAAQASELDNLPSTLTVRDSRIQEATMVGVAVLGSTATLERVHVLRARSIPSGDFGDGATVVWQLFDAAMTLIDSRIEGSARAGVSIFGAATTVRGTTLECNEFDLDGEPLEGRSFSFVDSGANRCGCQGAEWACKAVTSSLAAPAAH